jgi:peptidyl-tRNA hydrolase, PTH1 family
MENLYLIVGLGNPGEEYARTRHNAGFLVAAQLAERWRASWTYDKKFNALLARAETGGRRVVLCRPQTYMNSSGEAVAGLARYYQVPASQLLVLVDDADLPFGEIRMRPGGGSGGHHGLESIEQQMATQDYARLRIGIGRLDGARQITGYVLGRFSSTELRALDNVLKAASDQAETWVEAGVQRAMNQFNGVVVDPAEKGKEQ